MSENYGAIYADLEAMSKAFRTESSDFAKLRARMSPHSADSGDPTLNSGIMAALSILGACNAAVTAAMTEHADKVLAVHDAYQENDADVVLLYNNMIGKA